MTFAEFAADTPLYRIFDRKDGITEIRDVMDVSCYLVQGTERAALLDTGLGIGSLRAITDRLTDLPVSVYLTHGHVDHGGGIYDYSSAFVPEKDIPLLGRQTAPALRLGFAAAYNPKLLTISDIRDHMPYGTDIRLYPLQPGQEIALGGRTLTAVSLRGHTQGSVGYFDSRTKTLFAGDGCNNATFLFLRESTSVEEYFQMLLALRKDWMPRIMRLCICHGYFEIPLTTVDDLMECCESVLSGTDDAVAFEMPYAPFRNGKSFWANAGLDSRLTSDGKFGNLIYSPAGVASATKAPSGNT